MSPNKYNNQCLDFTIDIVLKHENDKDDENYEDGENYVTQSIKYCMS